MYNVHINDNYRIYILFFHSIKIRIYNFTGWANKSPYLRDHCRPTFLLVINDFIYWILCFLRHMNYITRVLFKHCYWLFTCFIYLLRLSINLHFVKFLQRVSIACYAERCISYDRFCLTVRPSDRLTVCPSHAGIMPKRLQLRSCGLHWRIAPWL